MKQCNAENAVAKNSLTNSLSNTQIAAFSATFTKLEKQRPTVPPQLAELCPPETAPVPVSAMADMLHDDGNHPHNVQQSSSLMATFKLQAQVMRTINTMLVELINTVDKLLAAITCPKTSPFPSCPSDWLPSTTPHTICYTTAFQLPHKHLPQAQIPPWPLHHADPCHKLAPNSKNLVHTKSSYCRTPFNHSHHSKASMHLP